MKKQIQLLRGTMIIIALLTINSTAFADFVITGGATIKVKSGTTLVSNVDVVVESTGTIDNSGTITLKGDFTNDGFANLGTGEFILAGAAGQNIGGTSVSEFATLTVNNTGAGVILTNSIRVDVALTLTDGLVSLGVGNMTLGSAILTIGGTPTVDNMIVTDGDGEVRKEFGGYLDGDSFAFPVGDNSGTAEYSEIIITYKGGDFVAGKYMGVKVTNDKHPNNNSHVHYLNRYWEVSENDVSGLLYRILANYVPADVIGTEGNIREGYFVTPDWFVYDVISSNSILFDANMDEAGDFTGVEFQYLAGLKVFLQGAYDATGDTMRTDMRNIMPRNADSAYLHLGYSGPEFVATMADIPPDAVDWVLVELRDATSALAASSGTVKETVAGFVLKDGSIVSMDGVSVLPFLSTLANPNTAFFVIIHRNHISAINATGVAKTNSTYVYDYAGAGMAYGTDAMIEIESGVWGLFAGETNTSNIITNSDKQAVDDNIDRLYHLGDVNLSGIISNEDKQFIDANIDSWGRVPK